MNVGSRRENGQEGSRRAGGERWWIKESRKKQSRKEQSRRGEIVRRKRGGGDKRRVGRERREIKDAGRKQDERAGKGSRVGGVSWKGERS